jgi:probable rRNA maturation factor
MVLLRMKYFINIKMRKNDISLVINDKNVTQRQIKSAFAKGVSVLKNVIVKKQVHGVIELNFVNDEEIKNINRQYRKIDKATDVISLSYLDGNKFPGDDLIGEIFISVDTAKRQAKEHGHAVNKELIFLFVHGLLHIFGYDHENQADKKLMFQLQDRILG